MRHPSVSSDSQRQLQLAYAGQSLVAHATNTSARWRQGDRAPAQRSIGSGGN